MATRLRGVHLALRPPPHSRLVSPASQDAIAPPPRVDVVLVFGSPGPPIGQGHLHVGSEAVGPFSHRPHDKVPLAPAGGLDVRLAQAREEPLLGGVAAVVLEHRCRQLRVPPARQVVVPAGGVLGRLGRLA
eukprot:scaffold20532_cov123-Isochrysis_galbana.AAC.4